MIRGNLWPSCFAPFTLDKSFYFITMLVFNEYIFQHISISFTPRAFLVFHIVTFAQLTANNSDQEQHRAVIKPL